MKRLRLALATASCAALLGGGAPVRAQTLELGTRVRVTAPSLDLLDYEGTVRALGDDGLTVDSMTVPLGAVTTLEVGAVRTRETVVGGIVGGAVGLGIARAVAGPGWGTGSKFAFLPGALTGAAIGASPRHATLYGAGASLAGGTLGAALCLAQCRRGDSDVSFGTYLAMYTGAPAAAGLVIGGVTGALTHFVQWRDVPLDALRVSVAAAPGGGPAPGVLLVLTLSTR